MRTAFVGGWGHHYLRAALSDPDLEIERPVCVAGDGYDNARAQTLAASLAGARWFDNPIQMLDTARPDAVSIGAVHGRNAALTIAALERGIAVVSDKPICTSWEELERLETLTTHTGLPLLTEFPFRAQAEFRAMRNAVAAGDIGTVVLATAQKSYKFGQRPEWYGRRDWYGGTLLWIASHGVDALQFVTGQSVQAVCGRQGNVSRPEYGAMEDHTTSLFALAGGGTGVVHADLLRADGAASHGDDRLRLAGSGGTLEVRDGRCLRTTHTRPEEDITGTVPPAAVYRELLAALRGKTEYYSTALSLQTARALLHARDLADAP